MSDYERNKGKLIPQSIDISKWDDDDIENLIDNGYQVIGGIVYSVEWEVEGFTDYMEFVDVEKKSDGSIHFHTLHYNGGAHWTEVVEDALNDV